MIGPLEVNLIAIAIMSNIGEQITKPINETKISKNLFKKYLYIHFAYFIIYNIITLQYLKVNGKVKF